MIVDFSRKRLPAQVSRYLEGVQFPPRRRCSERSSATVCLGRSSLSCASGSRRASTAAPGGLVGPATGALTGSSFPQRTFLELHQGEVRSSPGPMGENISGSRTVTSRNLLIHNGATNPTKSPLFGPKGVQQRLLPRPVTA